MIETEARRPNGYHRLKVLQKLDAAVVPAILIPEAEVAFLILALNTEKAHNLKEKSLEVIRMYRGLTEDEPKSGEQDAAFVRPDFRQAAREPAEVRRVEGALRGRPALGHRRPFVLARRRLGNAAWGSPLGQSDTEERQSRFASLSERCRAG